LEFFANEPGERKKKKGRDCDFISGSPAVRTGPKIEIAGNTQPRARLREGRGFVLRLGQNEIGLTSGLLWPGTALEQARNRSPRTRQRRGIAGER